VFHWIRKKSHQKKLQQESSKKEEKMTCSDEPSINHEKNNHNG